MRAFTRLVGPCASRENASVLGDRVRACSIGEVSKVRGEISETVVLGHANKGHDGFVGHSYLGRWVNLGAGTITSNSRTRTAPVQLWTPAGMRDTGACKSSARMFGDHVKTGIGTRLTTGTRDRRGRERLRGADAAQGRAAVLVGRTGAIREIEHAKVHRRGRADDGAAARADVGKAETST